MARSGTSEKLTSENIEKVISLLSPEDGSKPATKKDCCEILGIAYNVSRLQTIIDKYLEDKNYEEKMREEKSRTPASEQEIEFVINSYIKDGMTESAIAKSLYRSHAFVKKILVNYGVPLRAQSFDYKNPELLPDACVSDEFNIGEVVFCSKYNCMAEVSKELDKHKTEGRVYRVWLMDDWQQFATVAWYELGSLRHLKTYGLR